MADEKSASEIVTDQSVVVPTGSKLIVITGCSSGIGAECARWFHKEGHSVLCLARRLDKMKTILADLGSERVMFAKVDITDATTFKAAVDAAEAKFGGVDCLINNAGVMLLGSFMQQPVAEWKSMFGVNVDGVLNGCRIVCRGMSTRKSGTIINISSIAGVKLFPDHTVYCASKFAVGAISEGLRQEMAPFGVKVTVICPGVVNTELMDHNLDKKEIHASFMDWKKTLTQGSLEPEDIASTALFVYKLPKRACIRQVQIAPTSQIP